MEQETEVITEEQPKAVPEPAKVVPPQKLRRVIQPTDKDGHPIGAPHVYEADTQEEMDEKLSAAIAHGTRKIRELTLGAPVVITAPEGAELDEAEPEAIPEFKPRQLTADEKFSIAAKLRDPATVDEGFDELLAARTGGKPEDFVKLQTQGAKDAQKAARDAARVRARTEALAFQENHPEFVTNEANSNAMISYLSARKMACTLKNFEIAYKALTADGLLIIHAPEPEPKVVETVPVVNAEPPQVPRTEEPVAATRTRGTADLPSTISRTDNAPNTPVKSGKPSAAAIAMMTAKQFKEAVEKWPDLLKR